MKVSADWVARGLFNGFAFTVARTQHCLAWVAISFDENERIVIHVAVDYLRYDSDIGLEGLKKIKKALQKSVLQYGPEPSTYRIASEARYRLIHPPHYPSRMT